MPSKCDQSVSLQVGSSRAKDNAQKALEMLTAQHGRQSASPRPIPPTTPLDHPSIFGRKKEKRKTKKESITVDTVGNSAQASPAYHNLNDLD